MERDEGARQEEPFVKATSSEVQGWGHDELAKASWFPCASLHPAHADGQCSSVCTPTHPTEASATEAAFLCQALHYEFSATFGPPGSKGHERDPSIFDGLNPRATATFKQSL
eukprot:1157656-Pelagomonas_calceolata.AAC.2